MSNRLRATRLIPFRAVCEPPHQTRIVGGEEIECAAPDQRKFKCEVKIAQLKGGRYKTKSYVKGD